LTRLNSKLKRYKKDTRCQPNPTEKTTIIEGVVICLTARLILEPQLCNLRWFR